MTPAGGQTKIRVVGDCVLGRVRSAGSGAGVERLHYLYVRYADDVAAGFVAGFVRDRSEAEDITRKVPTEEARLAVSGRAAAG